MRGFGVRGQRERARRELAGSPRPLHEFAEAAADREALPASRGVETRKEGLCRRNRERDAFDRPRRALGKTERAEPRRSFHEHAMTAAVAVVRFVSRQGSDQECARNLVVRHRSSLRMKKGYDCSWPVTTPG
jgi:hypothetical protein